MESLELLSAVYRPSRNSKAFQFLLIKEDRNICLEFWNFTLVLSHVLSTLISKGKTDQFLNLYLNDVQVWSMHSFNLWTCSKDI